MGFDDGVRGTVAWYAANRDWWEPLRDRAPVVEDAWATSGTDEPDRAGHSESETERDIRPSEDEDG